MSRLNYDDSLSSGAAAAPSGSDGAGSGKRSEPVSLDKSLRLPKKVGSRELKTRLGTYLRLVKQGASFVVTDRGRPVAELRPLPVDEHALGDRLYELAAAGVIGQEIAERRSLEPFRPVATSASPQGSAAILEDREDRF